MQTIAHASLHCANLCSLCPSHAARYCTWSFDVICTDDKKAGTRRLRLSSWLCARIKLFFAHPYDALSRPEVGEPRVGVSSVRDYALRRGRTVKSRTCARMLDICIPFSCARNGMMSATN